MLLQFGYIFIASEQISWIWVGFQVMTKNLEPVIHMILNSFQDPHAKVRWAAINAIGQLSTDLGPYLQENFHQKVLPSLIRSLDDFENTRVQVLIVIFLGND